MSYFQIKVYSFFIQNLGLIPWYTDLNLMALYNNLCDYKY